MLSISDSLVYRVQHSILVKPQRFIGEIVQVHKTWVLLQEQIKSVHGIYRKEARDRKVQIISAEDNNL
jgi:hypothetical protein